MNLVREQHWSVTALIAVGALFLPRCCISSFLACVRYSAMRGRLRVRLGYRGAARCCAPLYV